MSIPMTLEYSSGAMSEFLDYMADKGLANKNTIASRKAACSKIFEILDSGERSDVRELEIDSVMARFANLKGTNYSPSSLTVYKSRFSKALGDFLTYKKDPASFKPSSISIPSKAEKKNQSASKKISQKEDDKSQGSTSEQGNQAMPPSAINLPIAIRADHIVTVSNLPVDLSPGEAEKISAVVKAMGVVYDN